MKWCELLDQHGLSGLKIGAAFLAAEFRPGEHDRDAAWAMYVELLTRVTGQTLQHEHGDEKAELDSVYQLFPLTREILRARGGRQAREFAKIAIVVLNQKVRPFTTKWHRLSLAAAFSGLARCKEFRDELAVLQDVLLRYTQLLGSMAGVPAHEDLTRIEAD